MRGQRLGKYEILARLTSGGMAELSLASTTGPGGFRKFVVIKRILPEAAEDENFVRMFLDEARVTGAFSHAGICQVFDLEKDPTSGLYVAMEFIAGQDLNQVVAACAEQRAVLPIGFSASVVHDCALALHYAHTFKLPNGDDSPVIHRDVAQKNVMVTYDGQVKLLDFGIAKARGALSKTRAGTVKGTAGYMSPEQVRGEPLDGRSDVFALGVVLWEMITGQRLFAGESEVAELKLILHAPIRPPSEVEPTVPPELSAVAMKALERDANQRFRSARELAKTLASTCSHLLFEPEERASFMKERFADKIRSARRLFDVASSRDEAALDEAVEAYRSSTTGAPVVRPRPVPRHAENSGGEGSGVTGRSRKAKKPAPAKVETSASAAPTVEFQPTERAVPVVKPRSHSVIWPMLAVLVALGVGWFVWRQMQPTVTPVSGKGVEVETPVPTPVTPVPSANVETGEVTMAFIPEATVLRGNQRLGQGSLINVTLPTGTHQVTVQFSSGEQRKLNLTVQPGKNRALKFHPDDLPAR